MFFFKICLSLSLSERRQRERERQMTEGGRERETIEMTCNLLENLHSTVKFDITYFMKSLEITQDNAKLPTIIKGGLCSHTKSSSKHMRVHPYLDLTGSRVY